MPLRRRLVNNALAADMTIDMTKPVSYLLGLDDVRETRLPYWSGASVNQTLLDSPAVGVNPSKSHYQHGSMVVQTVSFVKSPQRILIVDRVAKCASLQLPIVPLTASLLSRGPSSVCCHPSIWRIMCGLCCQRAVNAERVAW